MFNRINFTSNRIEYSILEDGKKTTVPYIDGYNLNVSNLEALKKDYFQANQITLTRPVDVLRECETSVLKKALLNNDRFKQEDVNLKELNVFNLKPKVNQEAVINASKRVTNDENIQKILVDFMLNEAIILRSKADTIPIMKNQYEDLKNKSNVIVLDINPQLNSGMQKSNTLMSNWYVDVNNISKENLVTLKQNELRTKAFRPSDFHSEWQQGTEVAKKLERCSNKAEIISMDKVRKVLDEIQGLPSEEILEIYSMGDLASVMKTINTNIVAPQKKMGYIGALVSQLEHASKDKDEITLVIPDDCSLSGSSMLYDSVKVLDKFLSNNPEKRVNVVFSPLILGDMAQTAFDRFMDKDFELDDSYFYSVSALKTDGTEAYSGIRSAFKRVKNAKNLTFEVTPSCLKAKPFFETEYFQGISDPIIKSKLTYLLQGPNVNGYPMFGGYGGCGVLVITPTEEFELEGKTYAGKIPTNSVGFMEVLGHQAGVLNDDSGSDKGLFTKGSGRGYARYCEWNGLANPELPEDRVPIIVSSDGIISLCK